MSIIVPGRKSLGRLVSEPGETLAASLRRSLLEMILFGYFVDGNRLRPTELARHFNVSPTPVREALMQIASEGYIEAIPRRGFRVRRLTARQIAELWQVRVGLEVQASKLVIERLVAGEIGEEALMPLRDIQRRRDDLGRRMTPKQHIELNAAFHHGLVELSGNRLLRSIYGAIQMQVAGAIVHPGSNAWRARLEEDAEEHHAIIASLAALDERRCAKVISDHIARSLAGALSDHNARMARESEPDHTRPQKQRSTQSPEEQARGGAR